MQHGVVIYFLIFTMTKTTAIILGLMIGVTAVSVYAAGKFYLMLGAVLCEPTEELFTPSDL